MNPRPIEGIVRDQFGRVVDHRWLAGDSSSSTLDTITSGNLNSTSGVPNTNSWSLDALGNWSSGAGSTNTFNSQNEETANGSSTLTYDNAGDMTKDELGNGYTFDAWGHVVGTRSATFQYDALGRNVIEL
jgi:hypothetical protein